MAVMCFLAGLPSKFESTKSQESGGIVCYYCHEPGHTKRACKTLQNKAQKTQSAHVTATDTSEKTVMISTDEFANFSQYQESLKSSSTSITALAESGYPSLFSTYQSHNSSSTVTLADGSTSCVLRSRSVNPTPLISLSSVLSLPQFAFNLISVSKLTRALKCCISFFPDHFMFQDLTTRQIIGKRHESEGLYILDTQTLRNDNAKEYFSSSFQSYMSQHGILHQSSCVDTPSQNGVAERKNRHLLETARALLFQMQVSKQFLADVVSTACFLINGMPSSILNGFTPYSVLFPSKPLFLIALKIFDNTCFVHDVQPQGEDDDLLIYTATSLPTTPTPEASPPTVPPSAPPPLRPVPQIRIIYSRRQEPPVPVPSSSDPVSSDPNTCVPHQENPQNSCPAQDSSSLDPTLSDLDLSITLQKEEMNVLNVNGTWTLVDLPTGKRHIGCKWVFAVKVNLDGSVARLKARPGEYGKVCHLCKSLYGLKQSLHAWFEKFNQVVEKFEMTKSKSDHSVFYKQSAVAIILLVVYVDDIIITGSDTTAISLLKSFLHTQFHTKDLGVLKYFLGVEVTSKKCIFLSQKKYVLDLLTETGRLRAKSCSTLMFSNSQLTKDGELFKDPKRYRRLVGKLNYLTVTRPNIAYSVNAIGRVPR
ncbi:uncharacterized protein LOC116144087 [Pistacia vera]|uniref:uncharacterized protein LOC116144087 n=1 Tax=Pistacia vera TaxID=55513 RepID=UPI001262ED5B|nr:uncharacterized protein LOC116144087 [Pistacia vera]